jgi:hypothetical protein
VGYLNFMLRCQIFVLGPQGTPVARGITRETITVDSATEYHANFRLPLPKLQRALRLALWKACHATQTFRRGVCRHIRDDFYSRFRLSLYSNRRTGPAPAYPDRDITTCLNSVAEVENLD